MVLSDPATDTVYVTNNTDNTVSVLNGAACDATHHAGCRHPAPSVPDHEFLIAADLATGTLYGGSLTGSQIDVISTTTCHTGNISDCAPVAEISTPDFGPNVGATDDATHTLYASDEAEAGAGAAGRIAAVQPGHRPGQAHRVRGEHLPRRLGEPVPDRRALTGADQRSRPAGGTSSMRAASPASSRRSAGRSVWS